MRKLFSLSSDQRSQNENKDLSLLAFQTVADVCIHFRAGLSPHSPTHPLQSTQHWSSKTHHTMSLPCLNVPLQGP